ELALGAAGALRQLAGTLQLAGARAQLPGLRIREVLRGAELVEHRLLALLVGLEAPAHLVDAAAELAHRVLERGVDAVGEVPLPELLGGAQDRREVALERRAEQEAQEDAADHRD